ncbi:hypothetical protein BCR35DRAFT_115950 [Leucosporidium creatinivorum]|uniref:Uncharacterized protein n=1 Tax=Leucosporidium creatinivorum TaxID=106004 RepID=A0A1Y2F032_9BASI|nr:hypothetical protein BCR35DRAFT_115950 [Leucosporidium creatinivorum]
MVVEEIDLTLSDDETSTPSDRSHGLPNATTGPLASPNRGQLRIGSARLGPGLASKELWDFEAMRAAGGLTRFMATPLKPSAAYFFERAPIKRPRRSIISLKGWTKVVQKTPERDVATKVPQINENDSPAKPAPPHPLPHHPEPVKTRLPHPLPSRPRSPSPPRASRLRSPSPPSKGVPQENRRRSPSPASRLPRWAPPSTASNDRGARWAAQSSEVEQRSRRPSPPPSSYGEQQRRGDTERYSDQRSRYFRSCSPPRERRRSRSPSPRRPPLHCRRRPSPSPPRRRPSRSPPRRSRLPPARAPPPPLPGRLPPPRLSVADRTDRCRALGVRDFQPFLQNRRVHVNWRYEYHQAQLDLILACQPERSSGPNSDPARASSTDL